MIYVVLDSSVIVKDFKFRSIHSKTLLEKSKEQVLTIAIPRVVFEEVTNKWREDFGSLAATMRNKMSQLGLDPGIIVIPDLEQQADNYAKWLRRHLAAHMVQILDLPDVSHETLLRAAVQKRKPFNSNGAGYRDALIWESIKELAAQSGSEIVFATNDLTDFSLKEGTNKGDLHLHPDLVSDLGEAHLNEDQITLITNGLSAVVEKVVNPAEAAQKWLTDKLSTKPAYKEKVLTALEAKLDRSIPIPDQDVRDGRIVREIEDVRLNPDKIYVEKAWVLRKTHIGVELTIEADIDVLLDAHRTSAKNGQLDPVNGDSLLERQAIHGYVNGQLEIQDGSDSDKIFDSYAYVARVSDRPMP